MDRRIEGLAHLGVRAFGRVHEDAATVVGVGRSRDVAGALQPVEDGRVLELQHVDVGGDFGCQEIGAERVDAEGRQADVGFAPVPWHHRHEHPSPPPGMHNPILGQLPQGPPDRVAVDTKATGQLRLRRQLVPGLVAMLPDVVGQGDGDGLPNRGAGHVTKLSQGKRCAVLGDSANICLVV